MRIVIQRSRQAEIRVNNETIAAIEYGLVLLIGIESDDTKEDVDYLVRKIIMMRIFSDESDKMNLSVRDINGSILSISQFTLHAETKKGNRPSFIQAAKPEIAVPLYELFNEGLRKNDLHVEQGVFGADMQVSLINDGPVTIMIDSKNK
ncbi:D-tyrosyl-tRNA(Tyr) deacylase [Carnobacterium iners]|uniref:D-aminoacyl-tRNA deacylase n=1 Tax=Carnobacterium iners TaxID=1073423 RepID=A0A1X7NIF8_9LACT|nr:D-aminoacyl-tRNA deacylase [Carnobacterium iners]SEK40697.1 D-tyrosyl-tRNA(Tyr) deacylase [Carnobacterium iners]SMH36756.1 D-tyrosyl-tRNA(Tyr) deacylase [Carnobacterium iners]